MADRPDSAVKRWLASGGSLRYSPDARRLLPDLFPYIVARKEFLISFSALGSLAGLILCAVFILWFVFGFRAKQELPPSQSVFQTPTQDAIELQVAMAHLQLPHQEAAKQPTATSPSVFALPFASTPFNLSEQLPTSTPFPTVTLEPTLTPFPTTTPLPVGRSAVVKAVKIRLAWYFPPLGGSNCPDGEVDCTHDKLLTGEEWVLNVGQVAACPAEFPLNSWVSVPGVGDYRCAARLSIVGCDYASLVCDVAVLSSGAVVPDWQTVYDSSLYIGR